VDTEKLKQTEKKTLSAYEKIYQDSQRRADDDTPLNKDVELEGTFYKIGPKRTAPEKFVPDFPYVMVKLSDNKEIMAPAEEHIAYLLTTLKIEANGLVSAGEEFTIVSNNEGFPEGFFRILPKYRYDRKGRKHRMDIELISVTINGEEYPYKITEVGNYLYIEPKKPLHLPTGIYTYRFNYVLDRVVDFYAQYDELYWDLTAKTLKNVVGSANAVVILPEGKTFLAQNAIASTVNGLDPLRVTITDLDSHSLGFADTEALAVGEDVHLLITLDKNTLLPPDIAQKYFWLIHDHGNLIFALLTLLATLLSFRVSANQIRRNQDKTQARIKKTPAMWRLINSNTYDLRSLGAEILNLCAKGVTELKKEGEISVLIKKTDNLKKLDKTELGLMKRLFPGEESILPAAASSRLRLTRADTFLKYTLYRKFQSYKFRLNGLYLLFSCTMLVLGILAAALLSINPGHTFTLIIICTALFFPLILGLSHRFNHRLLNLGSKLALCGLIFFIGSWLNIYTSTAYVILILLNVYLIIFYYRIFTKRNGLLRNKIKETEEYKSFLQKNPELTATSRDFALKAPYIFAFAIDNKYPNVAVFEHIKEIIKQL
jgi:hypothetical protein